MNIYNIKYLEKGYFEVKYFNITVIQDITAIKLTLGSENIENNGIIESTQFMRMVKLDKLTNTDFDDSKYYDRQVFEKKGNVGDDLDDLDNFFDC